MDIGRVYGRYLPLVPGQTPAARSDPKRSFFGKENLMLNRTNAYASSGRPRLTDAEIDELAVKYDFQNMTREDYDGFLDDLVEKGVLTKAETAYFGYGGTVRPDARSWWFPWRDRIAITARIRRSSGTGYTAMATWWPGWQS